MHLLKNTAARSKEFAAGATIFSGRRRQPRRPEKQSKHCGESGNRCQFTTTEITKGTKATKSTKDRFGFLLFRPP
jgi:hypothetical protein